MDLLREIEAEQIAALGKKIPDFKAGDTIRVGFKVTEGVRTRVQNYEGVCISRKNGKGIDGSFTVRKISFGEGVERVFPLHSTNMWGKPCTPRHSRASMGLKNVLSACHTSAGPTCAMCLRPQAFAMTKRLMGGPKKTTL